MDITSILTEIFNVFFTLGASGFLQVIIDLFLSLLASAA